MLGIIWTRQNINRRTGILSIMVGRPRKHGRREPNGRVQRAYVNPLAQVASQPHRQAVPARFREWPEAGSYFGRLMIVGTVSPAEHEAGKQYAEMHDRFRRAIMSPSPNPSAMDYEPRIAGSGDGMPDASAKRACEAYTAAYNAMENIGWQIAVMRHAVHDKPVSTDRERECLLCGLRKLVEHFGIDSRLQIVSRHKCKVQ